MPERAGATRDLALSASLMMSPAVAQAVMYINIVAGLLTLLAALIGAVIGWIRLRRLIAGSEGPWWRRLWLALVGPVPPKGGAS